MAVTITGAGLCSIIYFLGLSFISHFISRRTIAESSWKGRWNISWPRLCVLLVFIDSWFFLFASGFTSLAIGLEDGLAVCAAAIYFCICFYTTSKFFIYAFLIEKVHIVWSPVGTARFQSKIYVTCFISLLAYIVIIILNLFGRIHELNEDGCTIGLRSWSAFPLLVYDMTMNFALTGLFLYPLFKTNHLNHKLKRVAFRTLMAASAALSTSTLNILVLAILRGKEPGWVCLACCSGDVLVNAFAIYWATGLSSEGQKYTVTTFTEEIPVDSQRPFTPSFTPQKHNDTEFSHFSVRSRHFYRSPTSPLDVHPSPTNSPVDQKHCTPGYVGIQAIHRIPIVSSPMHGRPSGDTNGSDLDSIDVTLTTEDEILSAAFAEERRNSQSISSNVPSRVVSPDQLYRLPSRT